MTTVVAAAALACGESTPPPVATTLTVSGSIPAAASVGATLTPAVLVKDQNGSPMSGVPVTFAVTGGGGSLVGAGSATTGTDGVATVSGWKLGTAIGTNALTATAGTLPAVTFTVTTTAGAPAQVAKVSGDNATASAGAAVTSLPTVRVTDAFGNPIAGSSVTFAVATGGGTITGANATTSASGQASVGSWTLGTAAGANTLTATVAGLAPVTFTATASVPCTARTNGVAMTIGTPAQGEITTADCRLSSGLLVDFYNFTVATESMYRFTVRSPAFNSLIGLLNASGTLLGATDDSGTVTTAASIVGLLTPGAYSILAAPQTAGTTGAYTLSSASFATMDGCEAVYAVRGVSTTQRLTTTDCQVQDSGGDRYYTDFYIITVPPGATIGVTLTSTVFDTYLAVVDAQGAGAEDGAAGRKSSRVTLTVPAGHSGVFEIQASSWDALVTGAYTFAIDAPPATAAATDVVRLRVRTGPPFVLRGSKRR